MSPDESSQGPLDRFLSTVDRLPLAQNFSGGIAAFAGAFAAFVAVVTISGNTTWARPVATLKQLGNLFYNAQNVPVFIHREVTIGEQNAVQEATVNLLQRADPSLPHIVYYLIPVVVLAAVATFLTYRYLDVTDPIETGSAIVGGLTLGYLLSALVGAVLVAQRTELETAFETLSPDLFLTLAFGIAYPLVVGTLVVCVAVGWKRRTELIAAAKSQA